MLLMTKASWYEWKLVQKNLIYWSSKLKGKGNCELLTTCFLMFKLNNQNHCPKTDSFNSKLHQFTYRCLKKKRWEIRLQQMLLLVGKCKVGLTPFKLLLKEDSCLLTLQNTHQTGMVVLWLLHICYISSASIEWVITMSEENWSQCLCLYKVNKKHPVSLSGPEGTWQSMAYIHMAKLSSSLKHVSLVCIAYWEPSQACLTLQTVPRCCLEEC